jgi:hypothetical protein
MKRYIDKEEKSCVVKSIEEEKRTKKIFYCFRAFNRAKAHKSL